MLSDIGNRRKVRRRKRCRRELLGRRVVGKASRDTECRELKGKQLANGRTRWKSGKVVGGNVIRIYGKRRRDGPSHHNVVGLGLLCQICESQ